MIILSQPLLGALFLGIGLLFGYLAFRARQRAGSPGSPAEKAQRRTAVIFLVVGAFLLLYGLFR